jgi:hypothetical protein
MHFNFRARVRVYTYYCDTTCTEWTIQSALLLVKIAFPVNPLTSKQHACTASVP